MLPSGIVAPPSESQPVEKGPAVVAPVKPSSIQISKSLVTALEKGGENYSDSDSSSEGKDDSDPNQWSQVKKTHTSGNPSQHVPSTPVPQQVDEKVVQTLSSNMKATLIHDALYVKQRAKM